MKKLQSTWYNMAIVLTAIAVVAGAALGYVNNVTEGPIKIIKEKTELAAIAQVLGGGDVCISDTIKVLAQGAKDTTYIYRTDKGTAVKKTDPKGFGGKLTVMVGLAPDGTILGYKVLESKETPGLGAKAKDWFQQGQKGDIIGKKAGNLAVTKDKGGDVDAITASTITSKAFLRCINAAYEELSKDSSHEQSEARQQLER